MNVPVRFAAATDVGPTRPANEDSLVVAGTVVTGAHDLVLEGEMTAHDAGPLLAVVDGMGGHRAGALASALTARHLSDREALLTKGESAEEAAVELLDDCNRRLFDQMDRTPGSGGMGAAVAGLALFPGQTVVFNLGDVAIFQYASGYLLEVGERHRSPQGHLLQCLGGSTSPVPIRPSVAAHPSPPGSRWLVCTDGLSDVVDFDQLQDVLAGDGDLGKAVTVLLQTALAGGTDDNVTILLVET